MTLEAEEEDDGEQRASTQTPGTLRSELLLSPGSFAPPPLGPRVHDEGLLRRSGGACWVKVDTREGGERVGLGRCAGEGRLGAAEGKWRSHQERERRGRRRKVKGGVGGWEWEEEERPLRSPPRERDRAPDRALSRGRRGLPRCGLSATGSVGGLLTMRP